MATKNFYEVKYRRDGKIRREYHDTQGSANVRRSQLIANKRSVDDVRRVRVSVES